MTTSTTTVTAAMASASLLEALKSGSPGFIARLAIPRAQADLAFMTAQVRRSFAKLANQRHGERNYDTACEAPEASREKARLCTDRRAVLAEMLIADVLSATSADFALQPLVSHKIEPGADLSVLNKHFDVKSAGQLSPRWHGALYSGRAADDAQFIVNCQHHAGYCKDPQFEGYLCVYVYMHDDQPVAADIFYFSRAQLNSATKHESRLAPGAAMSYYSLQLPFPDSKHSEQLPERKLHMLGAEIAA